ncbi:MAG: transcriptional repressor [Elusimicrobiota bacterium]|jgi:Fe2+ or Zn2+ uptake regulation protein|nr:transcriptional repressor [Elusimicrobiota bacterium]
MDKRMTIQKMIVEKKVMSMKNHPCAEEVFQEIYKEHPHISKATVFRILSDLADSEKIYRLHTPYGANCFDYRTDPHYHIQCSKCESVEDIEVRDVQIPQNPLETNGFTVTGYTLVYEGICPHCKEASIEQNIVENSSDFQ